MAFVIIVTLSCRLFLGVYQHDEFTEEYLFIKHRPVWQWYFRTPIGMSDLTLDDLSEDRQWEEMRYDEFIRQRGHIR